MGTEERVNDKKPLLDVHTLIEAKSKLPHKTLADGSTLCPFCSNNDVHVQNMIKCGKHWVVRHSGRPYEGAQLHILIITVNHLEHVSELNSEAWNELLAMIKWTEERYKPKSGAIAFRFGDVVKCGGEVNHIHVNFIVADADASAPGFKQAVFPIGPRPKSPTPPKVVKD